MIFNGLVIAGEWLFLKAIVQKGSMGATTFHCAKLPPMAVIAAHFFCRPKTRLAPPNASAGEPFRHGYRTRLNLERSKKVISSA